MSISYLVYLIGSIDWRSRVAKSGRRARGLATEGTRDDMRSRIVAAAFDTLRDRGYADTSARAIAEVGGFNSAHVFYYFGSVNELLIAAFERSSLDQLSAYREAVEGVTSLADLFSA